MSGTERVRLDQLVGRTLTGRTAPVDAVSIGTAIGVSLTSGQGFPIEVDDDGTVEVKRTPPTVRDALAALVALFDEHAPSTGRNLARRDAAWADAREALAAKS